MSFVLDASAVLAVLLDEPGGDFVFDIMNSSHISVVNLSEEPFVKAMHGRRQNFARLPKNSDYRSAIGRVLPQRSLSHCLS
jgi:PIN domain nuclease of toxin-antitoxin system